MGQRDEKYWLEGVEDNTSKRSKKQIYYSDVFSGIYAIAKYLPKNIGIKEISE